MAQHHALSWSVEAVLLGVASCCLGKRSTSWMKDFKTVTQNYSDVSILIMQQFTKILLYVHLANVGKTSRSLVDL